MLVPVSPTVRRIDVKVRAKIGVSAPPRVTLITADVTALDDATALGDYYEIGMLNG